MLVLFELGDRVRLSRNATEIMLNCSGAAIHINGEFELYGFKVDPLVGSEGWITNIFPDGYVGVVFDEYPVKRIRALPPQPEEKIYPLHYPSRCFDKV